MPSGARTFVALGAGLAAAAVALGAFGAHALKSTLEGAALSVFQTAVQYHFYHALGLMLIGAVGLRARASRALFAAGWAMLAGIVLFSGSLYGLALTGIRGLGAVTPFGGVAFVAAWLLLAWAAMRA